ncbi:universal stress protein [Kribbella sp. NPDC048915]|uniref:universal stress protein n=1 Tax=Kribbella sp. NPDC048915 TaxID=3155148 RepID=UPI0033E64DD5
MTHAPVLVGIDGTRDGEIALTWAASYATLQDAPLHAVYVIDDDEPGPGASESGHDSRPDDGAEVLDRTAQELDRIGFPDATLDVHHGRPAQVLLDLAERSAALVVGRRGMGGFAELVLGSTSQVCTALSTDVPLIVVPDTWDPSAPAHGRIVVGIDGSIDGQDALQFAFELAAATHSGILGVHACGFRDDDHTQAPPNNTCDDLVTQALAGWAAKYPDVPVETRTVIDHAVPVLARESADADLMVVGGVGQTAFSELRLGSVARGLLFHSQCPVAVVHHQEY